MKLSYYEVIGQLFLAISAIFAVCGTASVAAEIWLAASTEVLEVITRAIIILVAINVQSIVGTLVCGAVGRWVIRLDKK